MFTTQLALAAGARVIALASPAHHDWLRGVGAIPLDYHDDTLADSIRTAAAGAPIAALLDTHGGGYVQLGLDLGIEPARVATLADFGAGRLGATVVGHAVAANATVLRELAASAASGRLQVPPSPPAIRWRACARPTLTSNTATRWARSC